MPLCEDQRIWDRRLVFKNFKTAVLRLNQYFQAWYTDSHFCQGNYSSKVLQQSLMLTLAEWCIHFWVRITFSYKFDIFFNGSHWVSPTGQSCTARITIGYYYRFMLLNASISVKHPDFTQHPLPQRLRKGLGSFGAYGQKNQVTLIRD